MKCHSLFFISSVAFSHHRTLIELWGILVKNLTVYLCPWTEILDIEIDGLFQVAWFCSFRLNSSGNKFPPKSRSETAILLWVWVGCLGRKY